MKNLQELKNIRIKQYKIINRILKMANKIEVLEHQIRLVEHMEYYKLSEKYLQEIYSKHRVIDKLFNMLEKTNKDNSNLFN